MNKVDTLNNLKVQQGDFVRVQAVPQGSRLNVGEYAKVINGTKGGLVVFSLESGRRMREGSDGYMFSKTNPRPLLNVAMPYLVDDRVDIKVSFSGSKYEPKKWSTMASLDPSKASLTTELPDDSKLMEISEATKEFNEARQRLIDLGVGVDVNDDVPF